MECFCLLLREKQYQTQTGLCKFETFLEVLGFQLASQWQIRGHCGPKLWAETLHCSGCENSAAALRLCLPLSKSECYALDFKTSRKRMRYPRITGYFAIMN
ncbi:hypothetical protein GOODEAATRI_025884 [Goodea atripinnis]|uniref:Uncharacterized protein n=1 Tax=Goodea atripinnis TaxID=208336 RepID=A0ABV0NDM4_9TELE